MTKEGRHLKKKEIAMEAPQNYEIPPTDAISTL